jgi:hypothetical protein
MTNEKAIEILEECWRYSRTYKYTDAEIREALEIAIKALEQQPSEDCISRTELLSRIDAERKHLLDIKMDGAEHVIVHHARRIIEDMPSVTPKENDKLKYLKGRPCEVCEYHSENGCSRWKCIFEEVTK